jgi:hypothetical protein
VAVASSPARERGEKSNAAVARRPTALDLRFLVGVFYVTRWVWNVDLLEWGLFCTSACCANLTAAIFARAGLVADRWARRT